MYTWTIDNDDMTLAQIVTRELLNNPKVTFAACKKRHPLESNIDITFSVKESEHPNKILKEAIDNMKVLISKLKNF